MCFDVERGPFFTVSEREGVQVQSGAGRLFLMASFSGSAGGGRFMLLKRSEKGQEGLAFSLAEPGERGRFCES